MIKCFMKKILMVLLSFLFAASLIIMLWSDRENMERMKVKGTSFIDGLEILHRKNGKTIWKLNARKADFTEDDNIVELSDLTVTIQKNGMILYADAGRYDLLSRNFIINSDIQAEAKDYRITTSSLDYDASSGSAKTDQRIIVEGKKFKVEGTGMTLDSEQTVRIRNNVKATFYK
jgi:lipopolysaccharide export system protein LptC